eukprot:evm.model.scf_491EXC.1 EVM.evm.TU.scf_491EXC.1   scf_491EXC:6794-10890(-)
MHSGNRLGGRGPPGLSGPGPTLRSAQSSPKVGRSGAICRADKSEADGPRRSGDGRADGSSLAPTWLKAPWWLRDAPQIRVRSAEQRSQEQLADLAVLNERLAGRPDPTQARRKLEYLKMRRQNWEQIYNHITRQDAVATLRSIEEANLRVEEALSEESRERTSVEDLRNQLETLQEEVNMAKQKLNVTEARVDFNVKRVKDLRQEAEVLERMKQGRTASMAAPIVTAQPQVSESFSDMDPQQGRRSANKCLHSSLDMEEGLKNFWYPVQFSSKLTDSTLTPFDLFDQPWVLFRDENGKPGCVMDQCAHRACPLSLGKVINGQVQCPYHGWEYDTKGNCTKQPSTHTGKAASRLGVLSLPVAERDGLIWVWPGDMEPTEVPDYTLPPKEYGVHAEIEVTVPVEHGLLLENLLDLAHAPFTHTSTFAKGWPIPDFVKFRTSQMLAGNWEPYPIDMAFEPPCIVLSTIGLAQPGKIERGVRAQECKNHLHQLHVCLPSKRGQVRLLYRMGLDFLQWAKDLPFTDLLWKNVANQVLGEDLVLVKGQQDRLISGADTWANPVSYDKLAVRYRRWRNSVAAGEKSSGRVTMSAGDIFKDEEEEEDGGDMPGPDVKPSKA